MIIFGIDPGTNITGYGIIEKKNGKLHARKYGCIKTDKKEKFSVRLAIIYEELIRLIKKYKPSISSIEEIFFSENTKTAISVGEARGVSILASEHCGLEVFEYTPLQIKQALVGYGRAEKQQVQKMVKILLTLNEIPKPDDAADALAVAICHANSYISSRVPIPNNRGTIRETRVYNDRICKGNFRI